MFVGELVGQRIFALTPTPLQVPFIVLATMLMRLMHGLVLHKLAMLAVKAAELNLDTSKAPVLEIAQVLTAVVTIKVFVPGVVKPGVTAPVLAFNQPPALAVENV